MAAVISTAAWLKVFLHAAKHEASEVNGLLMGVSMPTGGGRPRVVVEDAVPLFHHPTTAPMLEAATLMAEEWGAAQAPKLAVVGYYHANKRAKTHVLSPVAQRVADKVEANCPGAAIVLLDPDMIVSEPERALRLCAASTSGSDEGSWAPSDRSLKPRDPTTATAKTLAEHLAEGGPVDRVVDFDDHFDDVGADWRNPGLVTVAEEARGGEGGSESKGDEER
uniref:MPN domain-containing protein n=1 Tax=Bicosoecida sp. CB-2014 TaxID=1486930 RepID=A0A7S1G5B6_9STRA|mmetsp:Transcript_14323/g.49790  ORF Transcript_14323/g.49790 Transcript_14323/m.49790 type:complete len:222 (+) Transcript_14323:166-831(+)